MSSANFLRFCVLLPALCSLSSAQEESRAEVLLREWLASSAHPLASLDLAAPLEDLRVLGSLIGDARIVAIGEATHGTHEFFAFKARALRYMVSELGFRAFAMETDWVSARAADAWIQGGAGDVGHALRGLSTLWRTEEYRALLLWLREWNAQRPEAERVHLYGLDMQQPTLAAEAFCAYLKKVDGELAELLVSRIQQIASSGPSSAGGEEAAELDGLLMILDEQKDAFVAQSSLQEWALARQDAIVLRQGYTNQYEKRGLDQLAWRDRCMAENARWILSLDPKLRLVISAHNGHVSRDGLNRVEGYGLIASIGSVLSELYSSTSEDLSLFVLGTAFARGSFQAAPAGGGFPKAFEIAEPAPNSFELALLNAGLSTAIFDLRTIPTEGPLAAWFAEPRLLRGVGGMWDPALETSGQDVRLTRLQAEFDALLFLPTSTPARYVH